MKNIFQYLKILIEMDFTLPCSSSGVTYRYSSESQSRNRVKLQITMLSHTYLYGFSPPM